MPKDTASPADDTGATEAALAPAPEAVAPVASTIVSEAEAASENVLVEVQTELGKTEQVVLSWLNDHIYNTPISRATEALNYLRQHAVPDLINRIKEI